MTRVILVYGLDNVKTFLVLCGRQFITTDSEMKGLNPGGGDPYLFMGPIPGRFIPAM